jgi:heptaprenyl diphosphate synthase
MTHFWDDFPAIQHDLERVHDVILDNVRSRNVTITRALTNLANRNGKLLRPGFVLLSARLKGDLMNGNDGNGTMGNFVENGDFVGNGGFVGNGHGFSAEAAESGRGARTVAEIRPLPEKIYKIAASVEMLHMATLIHDDVIDEANNRRGQPTVHVEYGKKEAILMGDYLFSRTYRLLADNTSIENAKRLALVVSQIVAGEIDQSIPGEQISYGPRTYIRRVVGKTATLIADSFYLGASEADMGLARSTYLRRIGYSIGMAFQIIDDILDFTGSADVLGKAPGSDLRQGVVTLPLIYAMRANGKDVIWKRLYTPERLTSSDLTAIIEAIDREGGFAMARDKAEQYTRRALRQIAFLPRGENKDVLAAVARKLLDRTY